MEIQILISNEYTAPTRWHSFLGPQCPGTHSEHTGTTKQNLGDSLLRRQSSNAAVWDKLTRREWMRFIFHLLGCRCVRSRCSAVLKTNKKCKRTCEKTQFSFTIFPPTAHSVVTLGQNDWDERHLWNLERDGESGLSFAILTVTSLTSKS